MPYPFFPTPDPTGFGTAGAISPQAQGDAAMQGLLAWANGIGAASGPSRLPVGIGTVLGAGGQAGVNAYGGALQQGLNQALVGETLEDKRTQRKLTEQQVQQLLQRNQLINDFMQKLNAGATGGPGANSLPQPPSAMPGGIGAPSAGAPPLAAAPGSGPGLTPPMPVGAAPQIGQGAPGGMPGQGSPGPRAVSIGGVQLPYGVPAGNFALGLGADPEKALATLIDPKNYRMELPQGQNIVTMGSDGRPQVSFSVPKLPEGAVMMPDGTIGMPQGALPAIRASNYAASSGTSQGALPAELSKIGATGAQQRLTEKEKQLRQNYLDYGNYGLAGGGQMAGSTEELPGVAGTVIPPSKEQGPLPSAAKELDAALPAWQKTEEGWSTQLRPAQEAEQRLRSIAQAFKMTEAGQFATSKAQLAATLLALRIPVNEKMLGDPAAVQLALHENAVATLQRLKTVMAGTGSRLTQYEFKYLGQNAEHPDLQPAANLAMLSEDIGSLRQAQALPADWAKAKAQAGWRNPNAFETAWSQRNPLSRFVDETREGLGLLKGMPGATLDNPAKPTTQGEFDQLPKGAYYTDSAGNIRQKSSAAKRP